MTALRTLAEVEAAGYAAGLADPPLSQEQADYIAAVLYPHRELLAAHQNLPRPDTCSVAAGEAPEAHAPGDLATVRPGQPAKQDAA